MFSSWKIKHRIACPEHGYSESEAEYTDVLDWILSKLGFKEY